MKEKIFSNETIELFKNNQNKNSSISKIKKMIDEEPKNVNPLTEIPKSQMRLYGFSGAFYSAYFDKEEELKEWVKTHNTDFGDIVAIDYLGHVAGRDDVIRMTYASGKSSLCKAVDEDGYGIYNEERSTYKGEYVWEYTYGDLSEEYTAFRNRGIVFQNDIYKKMYEREARLFNAIGEGINKHLYKKEK